MSRLTDVLFDFLQLSDIRPSFFSVLNHLCLVRDGIVDILDKILNWGFLILTLIQTRIDDVFGRWRLEGGGVRHCPLIERSSSQRQTHSGEPSVNDQTSFRF